MQEKTLFDLPACKDLNEPVLVHISEQNQSDYLGFGRNFQTKIAAMDIAVDLVREWSLGHPGAHGDARPAIWITESPDGVPTAEEKRHYREGQDAYFRMAVNAAELLSRRGQRNEITNLHYVAAESLGITGRSWQEVEMSGNRVHCPFCDSMVAAAAPKCGNCGEIIDVRRYEQLKRERQEVAALENDQTLKEAFHMTDADASIVEGDGVEEGEGLDNIDNQRKNKRQNALRNLATVGARE